MRKLKSGDEVIVITGKDKGKTGKIVRVIENEKVVVENLNLAKRHTKGNPMKNTPGGIVEKEMPIHISNVALFNPLTNKADRVGIKTLEDGKKVRFFKSNQEVVDI
jgi:large subunit ribosomal protein L24